MEDSFSGYHPVINFGYFVAVLLFSMFILHPVFLLISLFAAFVYSGILKGWLKALKSALLCLPVIIIVMLINPLFILTTATPSRWNPLSTGYSWA